MATSAKRCSANRANSLRSTGPKTPEGKAVSSLNALAHGLTAQAAVLSGEDPEALAQLSRAMHRDLAPRNKLQEILIDQIVGVTWKLRRVAGAQTKIVERLERERGRDIEFRQTYGFGNYVQPDPISGADALERSVCSTADGAMIRLDSYEMKLQRTLLALMRELGKLRKMDDKTQRGEEQPADDRDQAIVETKPTSGESGSDIVEAALRPLQQTVGGEGIANRQNEAIAARVESG